MSSNNLSAASISHVISISYVVTVLVLCYFTIKVPSSKLKWGMCIVLALNMITEAILICLNGSNHYFYIKFLMFFNIAFSQLILASIYPLMMNIAKDDVIYTKKNFVESLSGKLGFLLAAIILGKTIFNTLIDYNICLLLSVIFNFLSLLVLINVQIDGKEDNKFNLPKTINYFNNNKVIYFFLFVNFLGELIWSTILGMPMLLLTGRLELSSSLASYMILGLGIISNILSMIIVKYLRFKNDNYNIIFKYGIRIILYFLIFITNNYTILLITLVYLFLSNSPYSFIFSGYFINNIKEEHALFLTILKYCSSLLGKSIGTFLCGMVFNLNLKYFIIPALIISIIHYIFATLLIKKRELLTKDSIKV